MTLLQEIGSHKPNPESVVLPEKIWGSVVSNMVSEWSQQIGLVLLTKKLIETGSKESSDNS